jgi:hypothetical protein
MFGEPKTFASSSPLSLASQWRLSSLQVRARQIGAVSRYLAVIQLRGAKVGGSQAVAEREKLRAAYAYSHERAI